VGLSPLGTAATSGLLYKPQMIDEGDCGAIGGMKIGSGNRSTRRKPSLAPLCPPQIPHDHARARTRAAAVGSRMVSSYLCKITSRITKVRFRNCARERKSSQGMGADCSITLPGSRCLSIHFLHIPSYHSPCHTKNIT
jgi:hypothetical protein